jgi:hypothetical protein
MNENTSSPKRSPFWTVAAVAVAIGAIGMVFWKEDGGSHLTCGPTGCAPAIVEPGPGKIDAALIKYREARKIATGFKEARGIALGADDTLYVAGDKSIRVFSENGALRSAFGTGAEPNCLAVGEDDAIYVGAGDHVEVYDLSGANKAKWGSFGLKSCITSIAASGNDVWVADAGNRAIYRCDGAGQVVSTLGKRDKSKNVPGIITPSPHLDVAPAPGGLVWVANPGRHELELYNEDGSIKRAWGKTSFGLEGFCGCCNPTDFAVFPDGRFVTSEKGLPRVKIYGPDGKFECVVASPDSFADGTAGIDIALGKDGRIFLLDPSTESVRIFMKKEAGK